MGHALVLLAPVVAWTGAPSSYRCMALPACARAIGGSRSPRFGSLIIIAIFARSRSCSACARASCARCCLDWRSEFIHLHGTPSLCPRYRGLALPAVWEFNNNSDLCALALVLCMRSCFLRPLLLGLALRAHTDAWHSQLVPVLSGARAPRGLGVGDLCARVGKKK